MRRVGSWLLWLFRDFQAAGRKHVVFHFLSFGIACYRRVSGQGEAQQYCDIRRQSSCSAARTVEETGIQRVYEAEVAITGA